LGCEPVNFFYSRDFNASENHSFEELSSILELSTRWSFTSIRELAIRRLEPPTPHQRLILGRKYGVDQWITLALQDLCERSQPLNPDEARQMDFEDVVLVWSVREKVRKQSLTVDSEGIRDCIVALRRGEPWEQPSGAQKRPSSTSVFGAAFPNTTNLATPTATRSMFGGFG